MGIGSQNGRFGQNVSIDGDKALIRALNLSRSGVVYVLEYNSTSWSETTILKPAIDEQVDLFGYSVILSGNRALIGAYGDATNGINSGSA